MMPDADACLLRSTSLSLFSGDNAFVSALGLVIAPAFVVCSSLDTFRRSSC